MSRNDEALRRARGEPPEQPAIDTDIETPWQFADGPALPSPARGPDARRAAPVEAPATAEAPSRPAEVPRRPVGDSDARLVSAPGANPMLVEQFRNLAAELNRQQRERAIKSLLVTSPAPGDGKSHVAVNLALTLSESYRHNVLLVDADMRRPTLHQLFHVSGAHGLLDALRAEAEEALPAVPVTSTLSLLPAGRPQLNPVGDLSSGRMARLIASAGSRFDWVIVDSPPAAGLADARIILATVDGAILVVRAGATRFADLQAAVDALGPERMLGVVLNAIDPDEIRRDDYYGNYYGTGNAG